jgi:hypothetical protein
MSVVWLGEHKTTKRVAWRSPINLFDRYKSRGQAKKITSWLFVSMEKSNEQPSTHPMNLLRELTPWRFVSWNTRRQAGWQTTSRACVRSGLRRTLKPGWGGGVNCTYHLPNPNYVWPCSSGTLKLLSVGHATSAPALHDRALLSSLRSRNRHDQVTRLLRGLT